MRILGFMSGTSLDGVDAAILSTDGEAVHDFGPTHLIAFTADERAVLKEATEQFVKTDTVQPNLLAKADAIIVDVHVRCARELLAKPDAGRVELIGYHGQTLLHRPERKLSIQIGDPAKIARAFGIDVVADVRQADLAAGGEGAPLVPIYHAALAQRINQPGPIAFLNVGGVANFTYVGTDGSIAALDTGPGNGMLDLMVQKRGLGRYDDGGSLAAVGRIDQAVLGQLLRHPYFEREGPKSLDRYDFPLDIVDPLTAPDAAATLVAFTAKSVALGASRLPEPPKLWIVCGGGRHNPIIMSALRAVLGVCENADDFGLRGDFIEAEALGFIAARSLRGLPVTLPRTTGVAVPTVAGKLYKSDAPSVALHNATLSGAS
jgi:anhydro-N-acetylmuramic acid kinase